MKLFQLIVTLLYRHPRTFISMCKKHRGITNYLLLIYGKWLMKRKAFKISPITSNIDGLPIYFLTGKQYLYQTLFCIKSLNKYCTEKLKFILIDDGTFDEKIIRDIEKKIIGIQIITEDEIEKNLQKTIPKALFPILHYKRKVYPHIKKLTDIHSIPDNDWKLVLDSDMLFLKKPKEIIKWLHAPSRPIYMLDCQESYGYSTILMENICKKKTPKNLNVGIIGLNSKTINWEDIENWIGKLENAEGSTYYLEQALSAMLIGETDSIILESEDYIVYPTLQNIKNKDGILHHYVDLSKEGYFRFSWKDTYE